MVTQTIKRKTTSKFALWNQQNENPKTWQRPRHEEKLPFPLLNISLTVNKMWATRIQKHKESNIRMASWELSHECEGSPHTGTRGRDPAPSQS